MAKSSNVLLTRRQHPRIRHFKRAIRRKHLQRAIRVHRPRYEQQQIPATILQKDFKSHPHHRQNKIPLFLTVPSGPPGGILRLCKLISIQKAGHHKLSHILPINLKIRFKNMSINKQTIHQNPSSQR